MKGKLRATDQRRSWPLFCWAAACCTISANGFSRVWKPDLQLWEFHRPLPSWVKAALPPSLCAHLASDPVSAMSAYVGVENPENDPQTKRFLEADKPAAIVQFPFPLGATGPDGRRVGEFEAARRIMSWGGEAVVLAPIPLALRVQELARILHVRQSRFPLI